MATACLAVLLSACTHVDETAMSGPDPPHATTTAPPLDVALIGGVSSKALVRVAINVESAREAARYDMGKPIRDVVQGLDGGVWLLHDGKHGRLLRLEPIG